MSDKDTMNQEQDDIAIRVSNLSKCYQIYDTPRDRLKQFILPRLQRAVDRQPTQYFREFWALKDVSFEVRKGETVGIIGRNGSGKSTLLQMICGTLNPTSGSITTHGRIAALLELGSGFNPEFTGRENVYMNASVLGLSKEEIDQRFDDIAAFADIGEFIEQPVKTYSSGMYVRLAFAVIAHADADILVVDEALAVGDVFFQQRCMRFLREFQSNRGTVLFVSHDTGAVLSLCNKAVLLIPKTSGAFLSDAETVCKLFLEHLYADPMRYIGCEMSVVAIEDTKPRRDISTADAERCLRTYDGDMALETVYVISSFRPDAESFGNGGAAIIDAGFLGKNDETISTVKGDEPVRFFIRVVTRKRIQWPAFGFMIKNNLGEYVYAEGTDMHFRNRELEFEDGDVATAVFAFTMPHLILGKYLVNVAFAEGLDDKHIQHCWMHDAIEVNVISGRLVHGYCGMNDMIMTISVNS